MKQAWVDTLDTWGFGYLGLWIPGAYLGLATLSH